jgi:hypothetical protein
MAIAVMAGCSNGVPLGPSTPPTSSAASAPPAPAPPTTPPATPAAVAYNPDLQPVFNTDCVPCHGGRSPAARYSMTTYAGVMGAVRPGSTSSALIIVTQSGGVMYPFLSGDRAAKAAMIRAWVLNGAPQTR